MSEINQNKNQNFLEKKAERAKDPHSRVILPKSAELKIIIGRIQLADVIINAFRQYGGLRYSEDIAEEAKNAFKEMIKSIDAFNEKYRNIVFPDSDREYHSVSFVGETENAMPAKKTKKEKDGEIN